METFKDIATATTAHYTKPTTAINRHLITPVHPSLYATQSLNHLGEYLQA